MSRMYFIPGERPESVTRHFQESWLTSVYLTVELPQGESIRGYTVPEQERHCPTFLQEAGLQEFMFNYTHEVLDNLFLVDLERRYSQAEDDDEGVDSDAEVYCTLRHPEILDTLFSIAQRHDVSLDVVPANDECFSGDECEECDDLEFYRQDSEGDEFILIFFNCVQNRHHFQYPLSAVYEHRFDPEDPVDRAVALNALLPTGQGELIEDSFGRTVAEVIDGDIYILFNISAQVSVVERSGILRRTSQELRYWPHFMTVLESILDQAIPIAKRQRGLDSSTETRQEQSDEDIQIATQRFSSVLQGGGVSSRIQSLERDVQVLEARVEQHRGQWMATYRQLEVRRSELTALKANIHQPSDYGVEEFNRILAMPDITRISVDGSDVIHVFTDTITIDYQGSTYLIGKFDLQIDIPQGHIWLRNVKNASQYREFDHPHIRDGYPCWGNTQGDVYQLLAERQIEMLVVLLLEFVRHFYPEGAPYTTVENWPQV